MSIKKCGFCLKQRLITMKFIAQIKEVKVRESASGDRETRIILVTEELTAAELMKYIGEEVVSVEVT